MGIRDLNSFTVEAAGVTLTSGFDNLEVPVAVTMHKA
jgi:hypothetical protein